MVIVVLITAVFIVIQKIISYSADVIGQKECPPIFPDAAGDSKLTNIKVNDPFDAKLPWEQKGGSINDASCLDKTYVYGVVQVKTVDDIKNVLIFAKEKGLKVSIAGVKHSMGGHAFFKNALVLDMTKFSGVSIDEKRKIMTAQSGATWHDIQNILHPKFAVKAMQSTDIFTVGGSISVNAHGMDHNAGSVARTIKSMRLMRPDGSIIRLSRVENSELFNLVIGGYGLFGIVLDADIEITDNIVYQSGRRVFNYKEFLSIFNDEILNDKKYGLMYGHLSTAPSSFLKEMILYTYKEVDDPNAEIPPLGEVSGIKFRRFVFNLSKKGSLAMSLKWFAEKYIEPRIESCSVVSRNQALGEGEACLVARNEPMHDSVPYLRNNLKNDTDILHEYFIPRGQFVIFVDGMRDILTKNGANLLNASVRVVHKEDNYLNYAPEDAFSVVLYLNQTTDKKGNERMAKVTRELIDLTSRVGGRFFLPYQLHYTAEQLEKSYPEINSFFALKKKYDLGEILTSTFYEKYKDL